MKNVLAWVLSFTKLGKVVEPVQKFLSGKKVYLAATALAVPAIVTMIQNFSDQGMAYLMSLPATPEYKMLMEAIGLSAARAAITKAANPAADPNK